LVMNCNSGVLICAVGDQTAAMRALDRRGRRLSAAGPPDAVSVGGIG
jgi:hypothetical protein